jgi:Arc/MetJ-type ribon-helix-helix transcriptional regulator
MTTLSVPLTPKLEGIIDSFIREGYAPNKAEVARKALLQVAEEKAIQDLLEAEQEVRDGKILRGDIRDILKKIE